MGAWKKSQASRQQGANFCFILSSVKLHCPIPIDETVFETRTASAKVAFIGRPMKCTSRNSIRRNDDEIIGAIKTTLHKFTAPIGPCVGGLVAVGDHSAGLEENMG
jgi:hypothetical protein